MQRRGDAGGHKKLCLDASSARENKNLVRSWEEDIFNSTKTKGPSFGSSGPEWSVLSADRWSISVCSSYSPPGRVGSLFSHFPALLLIFSHIYSVVVLKMSSELLAETSVFSGLSQYVESESQPDEDATAGNFFIKCGSSDAALA